MKISGLKRLAGNSYILDTNHATTTKIGDMDWTLIAGHELGGDKLSQWFVSAATGSTTRYDFAEADVVLFVVNGRGTISISGREFSFSANSGIYIAPGESFAIPRIDAGPLQMLVGVCPENISTPQLNNDAKFVLSIPQRVISLADQEQYATGDRFYQLLVNEQLGHCRVTQFIGSIPQSKAPAHFHEYEEIIMVLNGSGRFWTEKISAPITSGSIIYLPRKQSHCVECTDEKGMQLVGMFYPAGSPAVRY